jgi:hypothetical protein
MMILHILFEGMRIALLSVLSFSICHRCDDALVYYMGVVEQKRKYSRSTE